MAEGNQEKNPEYRPEEDLEFLTVHDLAKQRGCHVQTIKRHILRGILPKPQTPKGAKRQGWFKSYLNEWCRQKAKLDIQTVRQTG